MRHELKGTVEHDGEHYSYEAILWTGDDERRGDEVTEWSHENNPEIDHGGDFETCEAIEAAILDDANERIHNQEIRDDETFDEGMARLALFYHPEELKKMELAHEVETCRLVAGILELAENNLEGLRASGMTGAARDMLKISAYAEELKKRI